MKRDRNLHPLSWDHHGALTSVVFTRKLITAGADRGRLEQTAREYLTFHSEHLVPHFRHEEEWVLPRYVRHVSLEDHDVLRLLQEHIHLHRLVDDLRHSLQAGADLIPPLSALTDQLEAHVRFEERELFPKIEAALSADELAEIGESLWNVEQVPVVIPGGDGCKVNLAAKSAAGDMSEE
ncbi:MAG: hemerythrin domain-containing protein [Candidatus Zixiibacteriota bacterium]